jgi:CspA family cold shock protein
MRNSPFTSSSLTVAFVHLAVALLLFCIHVEHGYANETAAAPKPPTLTGTVKWFNDAKGYGFIVPDDGTDEIYVHHSRIEMEGFRTLAKGQRVRFVVTVSSRRREASNVEVIPDDKPQKGLK